MKIDQQLTTSLSLPFPDISSSTTIQVGLAEPDKTHAHEEANLLCASNIMESTIGKLPCEILSIIFRHVCAMRNFVEAFVAYYVETKTKPTQPLLQFTLGAVSSLWRQVVWSCLVLDIKERSAESYARILECYVINSSSRLLHVELCYTTPWEGCTQMMGEIILPKIERKVESLILVNFSDSSVAGLSNVKQLPFLYDLAVINDRDHELTYFTLDSEQVPDIERFSLCASTEWDKMELDLPWSSILMVVLHEVPVHVALQFLHECLYLICFCANTAKHVKSLDDHDRDFWLHGPLTRQQLKTFMWPSYGGPSVDNFLRQIRMPELKTLSAEYGSPEGNVWGEFFDHLPKSLETVSLHEFQLDACPNTTHPAHYLLNRNIEWLFLRDCNPKFVDDILDRLAMQREVDNEPEYLCEPGTLSICQQPKSIPGQVSLEVRSKMQKMLTRRFANCDPPTTEFFDFRDTVKEPILEGVMLDIY